MGNLPSLLWEDDEKDINTYVHARPNKHESVSIKLSCADFGKFNGRSDQWITFKENTLSKAGVGGYAQYFKAGFVETESNKEGNNRIFYLLQTATNGGGASHVVRKFITSADGHGAWQALLAWYEGPVMSGEIAKTLRSKLWSLRLRSRDDVNQHINDFTLYMDQLKDLAREEREETLTDLFLDSIVDPKFEVTVANCRLREHISIHECFEAIRKYDNIIIRSNVTVEEELRRKIRRVNGLNDKSQVNEKEDGRNKLDGSYRTYSEWQKLSHEQRKEILEARGKAKQHEGSTEVNDNTQEQIKQTQQRGRKRTRRVPVINDKEGTDTEPEEQS